MSISLPQLTLEGKRTGEYDVSSDIFGLTGGDALIHQAVRVAQHRCRQNIAHTKDRSERRGGGKKPWKQKGTGRARHGSSRSPIWRKGGVTFGPRNEREYSLTIPVKMRRRAMLCTLSLKVRGEHCFALETLSVKEPSTKAFISLFEAIAPKSSALLVTASADKAVVDSVANISRVNVTHMDALNILDLVNTKYLIFTEEALKKLETKYKK